MVSVARLDDTDPSITYRGSWWIGGRPNEYNTSTHGSKSVHSSASLTFRGTQIAIYATLDAKDPINPDPVSEIQIDGNVMSTYKPVLLDSEIQFRQKIFDSGVLLDGKHILSITSLVDSNTSIWLDYFEYIPSPLSPSESPDSNQPSTPIGGGSRLGLPSAVQVSGRSGLAWILLLLMVVCAICVWFWRQRRPQNDLRNYRPAPRGFVFKARKFLEDLWNNENLGENVRNVVRIRNNIHSLV
ncbi:hypothetical protein VKT23_008199 [Stygiomarasmius scandens]|uniref:Uncharacterized protein n=1 Tax=Marasmiellus scandens TaxID=2682957 RepID=A0ABR1JLT9_9AGAR